MTQKTSKKVNASMNLDVKDHIIFDGKMRKMLVEGVLQDLKGYIENKTNGLVEISYDDYNLKNHEFGFKLYIIKSSKCTKQMYNESTTAIVNAINYMFQGNNEQYDIMIFTEDNKLEIEFVSKW